ncbi:hypothetical protein BJ912DRAFT_1067823 [Pholiota molesta]|nr:hypothetical protein BJ912DRAFT_1067820 [Pholiota molesta]KAF8166717.1 hypothetical protein BJ912DRAFT_1067823 [Pholiota molesta]
MGTHKSGSRRTLDKNDAIARGRGREHRAAHTTERDREENTGALPASVKHPGRTDRRRAREAARRAESKKYGQRAGPWQHRSTATTQRTAWAMHTDDDAGLHDARLTACLGRQQLDSRAYGTRAPVRTYEQTSPGAQLTSSTSRAADEDQSEERNGRASHMDDIGARRHPDRTTGRRSHSAQGYGRLTAWHCLHDNASNREGVGDESLRENRRPRFVQRRAAGSLEVTHNCNPGSMEQPKYGSATRWEGDVHNDDEEGKGGRQPEVDVRRLCAAYRRMRGGLAEWIPAHGRRGKQLGAISERPPICSTSQRGRRPRAEGLVNNRARRALFLRIRSRKGTALAYRAASARANGLTGAIRGARRDICRGRSTLARCSYAGMECDNPKSSLVGQSDHIAIDEGTCGGEQRQPEPSSSAR